MNILFATGQKPYAWNSEHGLRGGTEKAVIAIAQGLARRGHRVVVNNDDRHGPIRDSAGVLWCCTATEPVEAWDAVVVLNQVGLVEKYRDERVILWVHDAVASGGSAREFPGAVVAVSEWHKANLVAAHGWLPEWIRVIRNGVDLPEGAIPVRDPRVAIYASHPRRGLATLLRLWSRIVWRVPEAKLLVFHSLELWKDEIEARQDDSAAWVHAFIERKLDQQDLVTEYRGHVAARTLATAMRGAGVLLYPTRFPETSCMTALEAQAAGMTVVTSTWGAMPEAVEYGVCVPGDPLSDAFGEAFVDEAVKALTRGEAERAPRTDYVAKMSWERRVDEWEELLSGPA